MKIPSTPGITLLGLGPGSPDLLTRQAWMILESAPEIYLRTRQHPAVAEFPAQVKVHSFETLFDPDASISSISERIVEMVLELGRRPQGVLYAVPGHPLIAETTGTEIAFRARAIGLPLKVIEGLSFLEPVFSALEQSPMPQTVLIDAFELARAHVPPFSTGTPALVTQVHSPKVALQVKQTLLALYPGEHPVQLVHAAGLHDERVERLSLAAIEQSSYTGSLTALYVPPLGTETSFEGFLEIIAHLRAPDGCPWDREQTHDTLRPYLLEEAYEVLAALDDGDPQDLAEEFGDLLLQVVLHAQIASEAGTFNMADILRGIYVKIVKRHPHVFGDVKLQDAQAVLQNWERLKEAERNEAGKSDQGIFDGIAKSLPALSQAQEIQRRAARVKFDWPEIAGVIDKVHEELDEVKTAADHQARAAEIGDLLFAVVNLARWYEVDAESALRETSSRFRARFAEIEKAARDQGRSITSFSMEEMEALWQSAKRKT
jgi:tetrapyrrole methylase family protein/MazG family protein